MMPKIHLLLYEIGSSQVFPNQTKAYGRETDTQHQLYTFTDSSLNVLSFDIVSLPFHYHS